MNIRHHHWEKITVYIRVFLYETRISLSYTQHPANLTLHGSDTDQFKILEPEDGLRKGPTVFPDTVDKSISGEGSLNLSNIYCSVVLTDMFGMSSITQSVTIGRLTTKLVVRGDLY